MKNEYEIKYHDVEIDHWWFRSRREYLLKLLKKAPKDSRILDIGCSSGVFLMDLQDAGFDADNLYGIDISEKAIENARRKGLKHVEVMDAQKIDLPVQFDIIVASDCLEHLQHDNVALGNWKTLLKDSGKMIVFVPAFMSLWSYHDEVNMHYRRYTRSELVSKMQKAGLAVRKSGYWNFSLFLPVFAFRKISGSISTNKSSESDISIQNGLLNRAILYLMQFENKALEIIRFPFGISTFCIVGKDR